MITCHYYDKKYVKKKEREFNGVKQEWTLLVLGWVTMYVSIRHGPHREH